MFKNHTKFVNPDHGICINKLYINVDENNNKYDLYSKIMCPVCDGQTIGESRASIINDMKKIIDNQISDGKTDDEILKYFEDRYGTEILSAPPNSGTNSIVWIAPLILISASFIIFSGWLKKSARIVKMTISSLD